MSTEAQRIEWSKRTDLVKRGEWIWNWCEHWPVAGLRSWLPKFVCAWSKDEMAFALGMTCGRFSCFVTRAYAWFTPDGEFVWGTLSA